LGRGYISGVFWASVVSIVGLGVLAQLGDMVGVLSKPDMQVQKTTPAVAETAPDKSADKVAEPVVSPQVAASQETNVSDEAKQTPQPQAGDAVAALKEPVAGNAPRAPHLQRH